MLLTGLGWGTILAVTLLTRPERPEVLQHFHGIVRPPGFRGPVACEVGGLFLLLAVSGTLFAR